MSESEACQQHTSEVEGASNVADPLTPSFSRTGLPEQVRTDREAQAATDEAAGENWAPAIDAQIAAHRLALDFLAQTHQWIADEFDFDLVGDTRPAAIWQMSGRCIGIGYLILDALQLGYTAEVMHLARALHEANRLAGTFGTEEGTDLLRKWLADEGDEWVRPSEVRIAEEQFDERLASAMQEAGMPRLEPTADRSREIYGQHSQAAHHRRRWSQDAVFPRLRTMMRGRSRRWIRRAGATAAMVAVVEESVMAVGDALQPFLPDGWYGEKVKPFLDAFAAVRQSQPLP